MKNLLLILMLLTFLACGPSEKKKYTLEVVYTTGETDTLIFKGLNRNTFRLENCDLKQVYGGSNTRTLLSGVRQYKVLKIESFGFTEKPEDENFTHELTLQ